MADTGKFIAIRVPAEMNEAVERLASNLSMTVSEVVREAILAFVTAADSEALEGSRELLEAWRGFHKLQSQERKAVEHQLRKINKRLSKIEKGF